MEKMNSDTIDRISELPESILHEIFNLLSFKQVARTSVLSRRWEQVWRTYPVFIIDHTILRFDYLFSPSHFDTMPAPPKRIRAINYMEQALRNRLCKDLICADELIIEIVLCASSDVVFVDRCLCCAIASNVKRLRLDFDNDDGAEHKKYDLLPIVLCWDSVELLELRYCNLKLPRANSNLSSLVELDLWDVDLDDDVFKCVLSGCPLLENLSLYYCIGLKTLKLFGHEKLKDIDIYGVGLRRVDIELKNVRSLFIVQDMEKGVFEIKMTGCINLRELRLVQANMYYSVSTVITELSLLEYLHLRDCEVGHKLKVSSAYLKTLEIEWCVELLELEIDSPNLSCFTYSGDMIKLHSNARALSKIKLSFDHLQSVKDYVKLVELLGQLHGCSEKLTLSHFNFNDELLIAAKGLRNKLPSPSFICQDITIYGSPSLFTMARSTDELLWIFPHAKTLSIHFNKFLGITCKFSYKNPLVYEEQYVSCCKSIPLLCWEQCIEKVEVEVVPPSQRGTRRRSLQTHFCLKGPEFLEKINGISSRIYI